MAVGISCCGTALPQAVSLLVTLLEDNVDFVRQGTLVALAMVLIQSTTTLEPKVNLFLFVIYQINSLWKLKIITIKFTKISMKIYFANLEQLFPKDFLRQEEEMLLSP
jgi:hypothetical protein